MTAFYVWIVILPRYYRILWRCHNQKVFTQKQKAQLHFLIKVWTFQWLLRFEINNYGCNRCEISKRSYSTGTLTRPSSNISIGYFNCIDEDNHDYDYADGNLKNYASLDTTKVERKPVYQSLINVERDLVRILSVCRNPILLEMHFLYNSNIF